MPMAKQVMIIYAGTKGFLDDIPVYEARRFETEFYKFMDSKYKDIEYDIETKKELDDALIERLDQALSEFKKVFVAGTK